MTGMKAARASASELWQGALSSRRDAAVILCLAVGRGLAAPRTADSAADSPQAVGPPSPSTP